LCELNNKLSGISNLKSILLPELQEDDIIKCVMEGVEQLLSGLPQGQQSTLIVAGTFFVPCSAQCAYLSLVYPLQ
jgi:hypothetical protein